MEDAETRAMEKVLEEGIFITRCLKEAFTGKEGESQIPIHLFSDSETLVTHIKSTKQIENRLLRPIIGSIKYLLDTIVILLNVKCTTTFYYKHIHIF